MSGDREREFRTIFGWGRDAYRLETWLNRSAEWVARFGEPLIKVGADEAGPWWKVHTSGVGSALCHAPGKNGLCMKSAGSGTVHAGAGPCAAHERLVDDVVAGGDGYRGRIGAWVMAHGFARALDCSPWEALLMAVKIAAGRVMYIEKKLGEATDDSQFMGDGDLAWWVRQGEFWHTQMAKVAKMAIDAGVAERMVRQVELEGELMIEATNRTFDEMGLDEMQKERALAMMSKHLLALESGEFAEQRLEVLDR